MILSKIFNNYSIINKNDNVVYIYIYILLSKSILKGILFAISKYDLYNFWFL
ncbi:hypothetical protein BCR36DRAFT_22374 [Piromyces finnis]|uniref:Uncharacterized protein n=1 Tax=Piromyces finnis TaxID=1754191 RepID=A0A1Y1VF01_9FUNG|nr:hypothetical protein BCR36DRAFT_22374 [Piromyces finnis]|eukprot:ORX53900.1 hypothetical protein BCR36DRAFT_22374 [Piromyces finnis]